MEEAWTTRFGMDASVHLNDFFPAPREWANADLIRKWSRIRELRKVATGALEIVRANKQIGSSLEANITLSVPEESDKALFDMVDLAELAITSSANVEVGGTSPEVMFSPASGGKCARCWRVLEETRTDTHLCNRCTDAVAALEPA
jgi:isoleucyl-tRNA synthetase